MTRMMLKLVVTCLIVFCIPGCSTGPTADLIFNNGVIWTGDEAQPRAQAVAMADGKFIAVGSDVEVLKYRGGSTRIINLRSRLAVPGFNDNHVHFASAARFLEFNIMRTGTQEEFVKRVQEVVSSLPAGEWIVGGFWGAYDQWAEGSTGTSGPGESFSPDMSQVEELTKDHPMLIRRFDNSRFAANRAALQAVGVDPDKPRAPAVKFLRDSSGRYTGLLEGKGVSELFEGKLPRSFSRQRRLKQTENALAEIRRHGVTNISDMSDPEQLEIYRELHKEGKLTVRVHFRYPLDEWQQLAAQDIQIGSGDEWIRLGALKGHIDGIMGTSSARFLEPYSNDRSNRGRWRRLMVDEDGNLAEGKFLKYMLDADKAGLQLTVHAIGDEANRLLLDYMDELVEQNGQRDRRFRLVHAQVIAPDDFKRLGELGIVAEVQPFHLSDDMRWMEERIGKERCQGAYAFKSIQDSGAVLSFGTDWPGTSAAEYPINPLLGIYAAVTRQTTQGIPRNGWFPEERISPEDALRAYTFNTAYANFEEDVKGSITVGKLADMTVLSKNLLKVQPYEILSTKVDFTVVDGKLVYSEEESEE